jgi:hypothetical protein
MTSHGGRFRFGAEIAGFVFFLVVAGAVLVFGFGTLKRLVRESAPVLLDSPGGPWAAGGVLGLVTVFGSLGALRLAPGFSDAAGPRRAIRTAGSGLCWAVAVGSGMYWLGALPGRNCSSSRPSCAYIPGTFTALIAYAITAGVVGWLLHRWIAARTEERRARDRERMRKLRKKGKGKSRTAARRG